MSEIRDPRPAAPRVLVVEDDADTRRLLVTALAQEGYEPIPALDGYHALRTALVAQPSAIVLDLMLPELDGEEFVRAYREQLRALAPIVVVSARHDAERVGAAIGARAVVRKPFQVQDLVAHVAASLQA
jgi:DNA-binding response OmpR family regulator